MGLNRETCYLCRASGQILHKDMKDHLFGAPGNWNYKSCEACGLIWLTPLPEDTEMSYINYYTHENAEEPKSVTKNKIEKLKTGIAAAAFGYPHLLIKKDRNIARLLSIIGPLNSIAARHVMWLKGNHAGRLLDVGCGDGLFLSRMQKFGWKTAGVEPDPKAAANAQNKIGASNIYSGFLEDAGLADNSFDAVTLGHVIEHLQDPVKTLRECHRLLRPGGRLIVTTPNAKSIGRRWFGRYWRGWEPPRHLFLFTEKSLLSCVRQAGFSICQARTSETTAFNIWRASVQLRDSAKNTRNASPRPPKVLSFQALAFLLTEYLLNLVLPCGEELVLISVKD